MPKAGGNVGPNNGQVNISNGNGGNNKMKQRFQVTCNYCGKFGHKEGDIRKKVVDAKNRGKEAASAAISGGNKVEFLLCAKAETP